MKKTFYEKIGRRYVPVAEYDGEYLDSFPKGTHLVMCYPGGQSRRYNVDPNYAAMIAAGRVAESAICNALVSASEMRPARTPLTEQQQAAWKNLAESFGDELATLNGASAGEIAKAGVKAMQDEVNQLMKNEGVRKSYEHFQLMCQLAKESEGN
jgi:hypothetical protein